MSSKKAAKKPAGKKDKKKIEPVIDGKDMAPFLNNAQTNMGIPSATVYERQIKPILSLLMGVVQGSLVIVPAESLKEPKDSDGDKSGE